MRKFLASVRWQNAQHQRFFQNVTYPEAPDEDAPVAQPHEKPMGFFQHLEELRWTLIKCALVYVVFASLIGVYLKEFNHVLMWPLEMVKASKPGFALDLKSIGIAEAFGIAFQVCLLGALAPAAPFMIYFVGRFVAPALSGKEMRMVVPGGVVALILFLMGASFGFFFLTPKTIETALDLNELLGFGVPNWTPASYYSILTWLVLGVGLGFEFPLLILLLIYLGLMTTAFLKKYRRHAIVVIFIISAVITPTTDFVTMTLFAAPLYVLYELAILAGVVIERRKLKRAQV